jgi:PAS domain S-box-containing protein
MPSLAAVRASSGSAPIARPPHDHVVQFYDDEDFLAGAVATFTEEGIAKGQPVVIIATEAHREAFCSILLQRGVNVDGASSSGRLVLRDAQKTLDTFLVDGKPDWDLFNRNIGGLLTAVAPRGVRPIRAYGEMVDLLWRQGKPQEAILLEELWNDIGQIHSFTLLCAYVMENFHREADEAEFRKVCSLHSRAVPAESYPKDADLDSRLAEISRLQQRARALEHEIERRKDLEHELRRALADRRSADEALRASQQELLDFVENAVEGLHWVGPDGTILWANRAELDLFGYSNQEYVGHNIAEFHADASLITDMLERLSRNETLRDWEAPIRCKDGSIRHVLVHSNALFREGRLVHTRCFTRDITDRKRLEDDLRRQNEDLARTVRFSEMFVGILGHDLRNPLSAITTAASLIARRSETEKMSLPATRILSSAGRMARMIDQLLDFTRIRLGSGLPLSRCAIDLAEVCRMAIDEMDGQASAVELRSDGDTVGSWDGDRLMQLVSNLVGNAVAHGARAAPVEIVLAGSDPAFVTLEVKNAGAIPAAVLPIIFEPFRSAKDRKEHHSSGLGLGLYISQQIVLAHSGSIEVCSVEEQGTCFTVRLPRA